MVKNLDIYIIQVPVLHMDRGDTNDSIFFDQSLKFLFVTTLRIFKI